MDLTCKFVNDEYKIWNPIKMIPITRYIDGEPVKTFFTKNVGWESDDVKAYWAYREEFGIWNLYRVYKNPGDRRLAWCSPIKCDLSMLMHRIQDKDITIHDCDAIDRADHYIHGPKKTITINWSVEYDGQSVLQLLKDKPKMSYKEVMNVITNEGGYVDAKSIIHKGTAENKIVKY